MKQKIFLLSFVCFFSCVTTFEENIENIGALDINLKIDIEYYSDNSFLPNNVFIKEMIVNGSKGFFPNQKDNSCIYIFPISNNMAPIAYKHLSVNLVREILNYKLSGINEITNSTIHWVIDLELKEEFKENEEEYLPYKDKYLDNQEAFTTRRIIISLAPQLIGFIEWYGFEEKLKLADDAKRIFFTEFENFEKYYLNIQYEETKYDFMELQSNLIDLDKKIDEFINHLSLHDLQIDKIKANLAESKVTKDRIISKMYDYNMEGEGVSDLYIDLSNYLNSVNEIKMSLHKILSGTREYTSRHSHN